MNTYTHLGVEPSQGKIVVLGGLTQSGTYSYDGMGGAISASESQLTDTPRDPLGNVLTKSTSGPGDLFTETYVYAPHSTQLRTVFHQLASDGRHESIEHGYTIAGVLAQLREAATELFAELPIGGRHVALREKLPRTGKARTTYCWPSGGG